MQYEHSRDFILPVVRDYLPEPDKARVLEIGSAEAGVLICFLFTHITYLWYNVVGCLLVIIFSIPIHFFLQARNTPGFVRRD